MTTQFSGLLTLSAMPALIIAQDAVVPTGPEFGKASPIGLVVILVLMASMVFLLRSMNKHLRRLPETFEPENPEPDQEADEGTDRGGIQSGQGS
ncbi:Hypothetical membrane protein [Hoyosella subflava DQS3-9A1]|uniref:Hypothetical membrane protein n=2 Tax=Hoyosella TaxID=697025 RepID=F6EQ38_HOYSD|nr:Hypothetical membrane protein [Hoyosella subflava DQS3-9A1]